MAHRYCELFVHLVWSTFDRARLVGPLVESDVWAAIGREARRSNCKAIEIGGTDDHVHSLVAMHPSTSVAELVKRMKGASSHMMTHVAAPERAFKWQEGYGAFSVSKANVDVVAAYIRGQRAHHASGRLVPGWEQTGFVPLVPQITGGVPEAPSNG